MRFVGVHYAITGEQRDALLALGDDNKKMDYFATEIEEAFDDEHGQVTSDAWEAIHCCLTDCDAPDPKAGEPPLNLAILGGQQVLKSEKAHIIRLIDEDQVKELTGALKGLDKAWLQGMYEKHSPDDGQEVIDATWEWFDLMRKFFGRAAKNGRPVLFTADQ